MRPISRRSRAAATAVAVTAALVLSACGSQDPTAQESASTDPATPTSPKSTSKQPAPTTSSSTSTTTSKKPSPTPTRTQTPTQTPTPTPTQTPTPTRTPTPTQTPTRTETPEPSASTSSTLEDDGKPLALGAKSPRVLAAQKQLKSLGYYMPAPDGSFGGGTQQAVWALQKVAGLPRTGQIDAATKSALERGVRGNPTISDGLEIDIARQVMYAVKGGSLLATINVSSGNGEKFKYPTEKDKDGKPTEWATERAITPKGSFDMTFSRDENWESTLELGSLYRPAYFNGGIAVHGSPSVPAYPASHGCVRVTNGTMDWLWTQGFNATGTFVMVR